MSIEETLKELPHCAGVYQYFDKDGHLLYVGKAKDLFKRVRSYFSFTPSLKPNPKLSVRIAKMIQQSVSLNYIVVKTEHDALILENSLIKQLNPKYNILLRDDKTYPYIYIDYSHPYPRVEITRKVIKSKDIKYFGPYSVGAKDIVNSIYDICKLVQKKGSLKSKKLCLYYQIDKCLGVCQKEISKERYNKELDLAISLIQNKKLLIQKLQNTMEFYAQELRFEEALEIRERIKRIEKTQIKSDIDFASGENYDIFVVKNHNLKAVVVRMFMRDGKIISSSHEVLHLNDGYDEDELYQRVVLDFYKGEKPPIVAPILVGCEFDSINILQDYLSGVFGKKTMLIYPKRGKKKELVDLAFFNADEFLKQRQESKEDVLLDDIKELYSLQRKPNRVEIFDNSHMSGMATVGAMVVWQDGSFDKNSYRTYHLDSKDEYAQMREVLSRRVESFEKNSPPDLWIIDGGTTLLGLAIDILHSSGVFLDVIAISKEKIDAKSHRAKGKAYDIVHTKDDTFRLKPSDKRLQWVQNLRDEAHRCAINFHKKTKLKMDKESKLLNINGISQAKIKKLLNHFGTFEAIKKLSVVEISLVLNTKDANIIKKFYK